MQVSTISLLVALTCAAGCANNPADEGEASQDGISKSVTPLGPDPAGTKTKYPMVIANGVFSNGSTLDPIIEAWKADGHAAYLTYVPAAHSVETRTASLVKQVDQILLETNAEKVNLVGYSMGALDVRYLVSTLHYGDRVASITTLSGVNKGTPAADTAAWLLRKLPADWEKGIGAFIAGFGIEANPLLAQPELLRLAEEMSTDGMAAFAVANPDDPQVRYQSYASLTTSFGRQGPKQLPACGTILGGNAVPDVMNSALNGGLFVLAPSLITTPSDGIVSVESQKLGEFLGCVPTDHWGIIGSTRPLGPDPRTGFDVVRFYRNVAFDLALKGL